MLLLDTSALLAALDAVQARHAECAAVIAELDDLLGSRAGASAQQALLAEVARGAYRFELFGAADVEVARTVVEKYRISKSGWPMRRSWCWPRDIVRATS